MRPLPVILVGLFLMEAALFVSVASLIRFSPADPEPIGYDGFGAPLYDWPTPAPSPEPAGHTEADTPGT